MQVEPDLHFSGSSRTFEAGTKNGAFDFRLRAFAVCQKRTILAFTKKYL